MVSALALLEFSLSAVHELDVPAHVSVQPGLKKNIWSSLVYLYPLKGNKNQWLEFPGTLGFLFQLTDRKGWIQQSSPWSSFCSGFLNSGFTLLSCSQPHWCDLMYGTVLGFWYFHVLPISDRCFFNFLASNLTHMNRYIVIVFSGKVQDLQASMAEPWSRKPDL